MELKTPWLSSYGNVPFYLEYPNTTMYESVFDIGKQRKNVTALHFMGRNIKYRTMMKEINKVARCFVNMGVKKDMVVTICMPNVPQAVYCLYALNKIGAVASMIHPLSAENEIVFYLQETGSEMLVTLDLFYGKIMNILDKTKLKKVLIADIATELPPIKSVLYHMLRKQKSKVIETEIVEKWTTFLNRNKKEKDYKANRKAEDLAVILFSGGTTGTTKAIQLSNLNFNALALQTKVMGMGEDIRFAGKMLAAMPVFHGFGLGVCIHTALFCGGTVILVPKFNVKEYALLIKKHKPNYIAGVPTLYEAIIRTNYLDKVDLSCLRGVFSGGDSLSVNLKKKIDKFLKQHNASVRVREGYGTTECVTASCLTPYCEEREGSIGLPYPDTYYKIVEPGTTKEVPYDTDGEICLTGPTIMLGYMNKPEENAKTLQKHEDGHIWLHTGDMGHMDKDGFIYFKQRIKRMIITSGYNVYPSQIENVIEGHEAVQLSCVIGIPDDYKQQRVKAFIVLKKGHKPSEELKKDILDHCAKSIAKYATPREIEFRDDLPRTLVGKVSFRVLEQEELEKYNKKASR